jgi:magnesium-transporting ATPase (P-type)
MIWEQLEDPILRILIVAAMISLAVGIIEEPVDGWMEGAAILFAVVLVVLVTAANDYAKQKQFRRLNASVEARDVTVRRDSVIQVIPIRELLVGDILIVRTGDLIPVDGLLVNAYELRAD